MKITVLDLFMVAAGWLFLKISTDEGLVGWGEPIVEGHTRPVEAAVREMESFLIGRDPDAIEDIWQMLYRARFYRGGPVMMSAIAGVDQALWDIKGKRYGLPVYQLLGGAVRDKMPVYSWIGGDRPSDLAAAAQDRLSLGFSAGKMNATEEMHYIASVAAVEQAARRVPTGRGAVLSRPAISAAFYGR